MANELGTSDRKRTFKSSLLRTSVTSVTSVTSSGDEIW